MKKNKKYCDYCGTTTNYQYRKTDYGILCDKHYKQYNKGKLGNTREIEYHGKRDSVEFFTWQRAKQRCHNLNNQNYKDYGGRGISMCEEWKNSFIAFYRDMGDRPSNEHSLDRIDNDGNYCKKNCRWATKSQQIKNRRKSILNNSGTIGVNITRCNTWIARITIKGKRIYLGTFSHKKEAIKARKQAEINFDYFNN